MDNVIDKLILEWSWRCEKGYPDINDPVDRVILERLLEEYGVNQDTFIKEEQEKKEENSIRVDDIIRLLKVKDEELTDEQKSKIFKIIEKVGKGLSSSLYEKLLSKNLTEQQASVIVGFADRVNIEDKILESLENPKNTFSRLGTEGSLTGKLKSLSGIKEEHLDKLISFTIGKTKSIGRGELALISLLHDTYAASKGDVELSDGSIIEIKATGTTGAIVAPDTINRGDSKYPISKIIEIFGNDFPEMKNIGDLYGIWPDRLQKYYVRIEKEEEKKTFIKLIRELTKKMYGTFVPTDDINTYSSVEYRELVSKSLAKVYLKGKNVLFISSNNDFILLDGNTVENNIGKELKIGGFSDALPRISYGGSTIKEDI